MAHSITRQPQAWPPAPPKRRGKYDRWLDGRAWELKLADAPWFRGARQLRRALAQRAARRGMRLYAQWLEDGTLVAQALPRREETRD